MTTTGEVSFTRKEVEKLLTACTSLEDEVLVRLAATTGLRRVDISRVAIANINIAEGKLTYTEHKKWVGGKKGDAGATQRIRTIPLHPTVVQKIGQLIDSLGKAGIKKNRGFLFSWGKSRWGDKTAWYRLQALCERADIPPRMFHAFRATAIKLMQQAGYSPEEVARITGDTIPVIQRHYSTPTEAELTETVRQKELI